MIVDHLTGAPWGLGTGRVGGTGGLRKEPEVEESCLSLIPLEKAQAEGRKRLQRHLQEEDGRGLGRSSSGP